MLNSQNIFLLSIIVFVLVIRKAFSCISSSENIFVNSIILFINNDFIHEIVQNDNPIQYVEIEKNNNKDVISS